MNRIKELRSKKNISTQELAGATGIARSTLGSYETRGINPNAEKAQILTDYFGVSTLYLLGISDEKIMSEAETRPPTEEELENRDKELVPNLLNSPDGVKEILADPQLVDILRSYFYSNDNGKKLIYEISNYIFQNPQKFQKSNVSSKEDE